jgi:hypothetical protein
LLHDRRRTLRHGGAGATGVGSFYPLTIVKLSDRDVERKPPEVAVIVASIGTSR